MTPATRALRRLGLAYRTIEYDADPAHASHGEAAATALGVPAEQVFKTLVAALADGDTCVVVVPVSERADLKAVARAAGAKRAAMADPADAERLTGYVVGGISPFGQRRRLRTLVDETAQLFDEVYVSGGRRGLELCVAPDVFVRALDATFAVLTS